ncbi:MAG: arylsulfotransferase family protein [Thermoleophilaceae bacterium]
MAERIRPIGIVVAGAIACAVAGLAAGAPAAETPGATISTDPALHPGFDRRIHDYVSRCGASGELRISASPPEGGTVSVDGGHPWTVEHTTSVRLHGGQGVVVRAESPDGADTYRVRCLPSGFPRWSSERSGTTQAQWYLLAPVGGHHMRWVAIFDHDGAPVWWKHTNGRPFNATLLADGHIAWYRYFKSKFGVRWDTSYEEHRLDGKRVRDLAAVGVPTDFHELQQLPNGHFMVEGYKPRHHVDLTPYGGPSDATVYDSVIQEITRDGRLVWHWSSRGHIAISEAKRWWPRLGGRPRKRPPSEPGYDVVHLNSISPDGDGLVISARHTDALYRIDRASGRIDWKLGGTHTPESLSIVGDPQYGTTTFGGQHDARALPDGSITVFDNGTDRHRPPRAVRYVIDPGARTATLVEQLTHPDAPASQWGGSARKLPGGNWVTAWGGLKLLTETTPAGERVFRLTLRKGSWYRAFPVPYGTLSASRLRDAMEEMHPR